MTGTVRYHVALVGIGNPLAGDDGVGLEVLRLLRERFNGDSRLLFHELQCDVFGIADLLPLARRFIFLDAVAGDRPGEILFSKDAMRAYAPSFHQADIGSAVRALEQLGIADPFPEWEIWGITIRPPDELRIGLTEAVSSAAVRLAETGSNRLRGWL